MKSRSQSQDSEPNTRDNASGPLSDKEKILFLLSQDPNAKNIKDFSDSINEALNSLDDYKDFEDFIGLLTHQYQINSSADWQFTLATRIFNLISEARGINQNQLEKWAKPYAEWANIILAITKTRSNATYEEKSAAYLNVSNTRVESLPQNATLEDENTQKLLQFLEEIVDFHEAQTEPNQYFLNAAKFQLSGLYASHPQSPQNNNPDLENAILWQELMQQTPEAASNELEQPEAHNPPQANNNSPQQPHIQEVRKEVHKKIKQAAELAYNNLLALTNYYLNKNDLDYFKQQKFQLLKNILLNRNDNQQTHYECVIAFQKKLIGMDKSMLCHQRTPGWKLFVYNALSFITILPAIIRMCSSLYHYNTACFWRSASHMAVDCAKANIANVQRLGRKFSN